MKYQMKTNSIKLLLIVSLGLFMTGCGWSFSAFEYDSTIEAQPMTAGSETPPVVDAEGDTVDPVLTTPVGTIGTVMTPSIPPVDILTTIMTQPTVDAAKVLAVCVVGDPAAIGAWRINANQFQKITVRKRVFVIRTKDSK